MHWQEHGDDTDNNLSFASCLLLSGLSRSASGMWLAAASVPIQHQQQLSMQGELVVVA